ncbi:MAG: hypothetical protein HY936_09355 [Nitrosomonadales bacterium]|nr:hypothetical protein [Nitrosomonadales bacterium]
MNSSGSPNGQGSAGGEDKRVNAHLRVVFGTACQITAPFFDPAQGWGGKPLTLYARQTLHEKYPDLTQQDVAILFSAVQRFHSGNTSK